MSTPCDMCQGVSDDDDDRFERWCAANGVVALQWNGNGHTYFRADGSEVVPETSYPFDAPLTPYTAVAGNA